MYIGSFAGYVLTGYDKVTKGTYPMNLHSLDTTPSGFQGFLGPAAAK